MTAPRKLCSVAVVQRLEVTTSTFLKYTFGGKYEGFAGVLEKANLSSVVSWIQHTALSIPINAKCGKNV